MLPVSHWLAPALLAIGAFLGPVWAAEDDLSTAQDSRDKGLGDRVRSLFSDRCFACHGPDQAERQGGFRLDVRESFLLEADSGNPPVVPGNPDASELWQRINSADPYERMPPADFGATLSAEEIDLVRAWISAGAELPTHWSFVPPTRAVVANIPGVRWETPEKDTRRNQMPSASREREGTTQASIPGVGREAVGGKQASSIQASITRITGSVWQAHPVDRFVLRQLRQRGWHPSQPAERAVLLRRVSLDLTGLPPTLREVEEFVNDDSPDAYERQVDRLLASPAYGEHWARKWLDLARYADSAGYADDPPRTIWAYRDWVIRALNDNMSIDQFTIRQLAGDLLPSPTQDDLVATAFHRNTLTNNEGGTNDEEFRNVAIVDRVNTTMSVWMGLTMACAQCHTHKYDPFTQAEYFQLFDIFNQTQDADRRDESPTLDLYTREQQRSRQVWQRRRDELEEFLAGPGRSTETESGLSHESAKVELAELDRQLERHKPVTSVPVLREVAPDLRRETKVQIRGNYRSLGAKVEAGTPSIFPPVKPESGKVDRLALATWLVDRGNPLTARVWMNRLWESLFGIGLVRSSEDFGTQGDRPSHPKLLDWLAIELMDSGWDQKQLLRCLVTSQTYRQSSRVSTEMYARDKDNVWLARGPRVRLTAEMVRDQALAAAGLLSRKMYGPPVRPPQPDMGLKAAFGSATDWEASTGEDRYRRGLYTRWRRTNPYPSMVTFDAPSREVCTLKRDATNTPLQALVTLNDPAFFEAAQALARRVVLDMPNCTADRERIQAAFQLCTSRRPEAKELQSLLRLLEHARRQLREDPESARVLASDPLGPLPDQADPVELAAFAALCNVLFNLDEVLMKR